MDLRQIPGSLEHPSSHGAMQRTGTRMYCRYLAPWSTRLPMEPCSGLAGGSTADTWLLGAPAFPWSHAAGWQKDLLQIPGSVEHPSPHGAMQRTGTRNLMQIPGSLEHPSSHGAMQRTGTRIYCRYLAPWSTRLPMEPCSGLARGSTSETWLPGAPVFPWSHAADWHEDLLQKPGSLEHPSSHGAM